jgi:aminoglycoside phosphotransferase (APT) family kinase protein
MTVEIAHQLALVRAACRTIAAKEPNAARDISQVVEALDRLIVEVGVARDIRGAAAKKLVALSGRSDSDDYEAEGRRVAARLRQIDLTGGAAVAHLNAILEIDRTHWQGCEDAIRRELAASRAQARADDPRSAGPIDCEVLTAFIRDHVAGEMEARVTGARVASEGFSKKTLFVSLTNNRVLPHEIVVRKDKCFGILTTTVRDEYPALRLLHANGAPVPEAFALEPDGTVLGGSFMLMERLRGGNAGGNYFPPPRNDKLMASVAAALARIHATPVDNPSRVGAKRADSRPYIEYELEKYWADWLATGAICPTVEAAFAWIRANVANAHGVLTIVHNDFAFHNIIVEGDAVSGVVDWEFVHIGNPAADLGYFAHSADHMGGFDRFLAFYEQAGGRLPSRAELDFYIIWGHLRLAVMLFQTEINCLQGKYEDIRYALAGVHYLRQPMLALAYYLTRITSR